MADNFQIKKTNFLSILENDISRAGLFVKWIPFLNEGSICNYALTYSVQLNFGLLRQVFITTKKSNQGEVLGFKFRLQNRYVYITESDINAALQLPVDNFAEYPTNEELLRFFLWMQCTLDENNMVPRVVYQNHLPKECHLFFTTISHVFAPKISGFHGISRMIQIIRFAIAHNRRINFGHLIMEEIIKNQQSARGHYCLYSRFLQIVLEHRLTEAQLRIYSRSRMIEPSVLSLRPAMVLLNNAHYPNVVMPARITNHIRNFFIALDQVVANVQEEEEAGDEEHQEDQDDQGSDSSNVESESLDLDQPEASGIQKSPEITKAPAGQVSEEVYIPEQQSEAADEGNLLNFDLGDFFGSEYLSFLDSTEPHQALHTQPSVGIQTGKESGNPPVLTTAEVQQTQSLFTSLPLKRKILYVSERVNIKKEPKREWYDVFVLENAALPTSKRPRLTHEASVKLNPIYPNEPNIQHLST